MTDAAGTSLFYTEDERKEGEAGITNRQELTSTYGVEAADD